MNIAKTFVKTFTFLTPYIAMGLHSQAVESHCITEGTTKGTLWVLKDRSTVLAIGNLYREYYSKESALQGFSIVPRSELCRK